MEYQNVKERNKGLVDALYLVKYETDESESHLKVIDAELCRKCEDKLCIVRCPAEVYLWDEAKDELEIAYENCLECGACRIVCPFDNIEWRYPRGGFGVAYKFG